MSKKCIKLDRKTKIYIYPTKPFNFEGTFFKPSHFPSKLVKYIKGKLYQGIRVNGRPFGLAISDSIKEDKARISVDIYFTKNISEVAKEKIKLEIIKRYDLDSDIEDFIEKFKLDRLLSAPIKSLGGMKPSTAYSLYGFLMVATVLQNTTVGRSVKMMDTLLSNLGTKLVYANQEIFLLWLPEDIERVSEEFLRKLKIGYRAKIIKRISHAFVIKEITEEKLREKANKEEIGKDLLELYGVGRQTVSYVLFEVFHFYNAFCYIAPWEQKIFSKLIFNKNKVPVADILAIAEERWGKWWMLAMHYLFEDIFWRNKKQKIDWLEKEIRM
ncbi:MAG: hypothetical protein ACKKMO_01390 [Candidatus Nealsonbacteria bacterium]